MKLRIRPLDTLFFRDGKPFSMGEDTWADGVFPPYPSVFYGALRTWYISNHPVPFSPEAIKKSEEIIIQNIQYRLPTGRHLPMPLDLVEPKEKEPAVFNAEEREKTYRVIKLALHENSNALSNHPLKLTGLLFPPEKMEVEALEDGLISNEGDFINYLQGKLQEAKILKIKDSAQTEPKVGIGRDDHTNTASDSMLYRVGMRRATNFEILIDFSLPDGNNKYKSSLLKLGAEGKFVAFEEPGKGRNYGAGIDKNTISLTNNTFKLYLATPAIFKKGWEPDLAGLGIQAELIAAAIGKPIHIGGFDMAAKCPKPMYKAVPAGSVYYFKTEESPEVILEKLQGEAISDVQKEQGFGIAYIGNF